MKLGDVPVLSVKQPYASLIAHGYKDVENRTWQPRDLGQLAIHASKQWSTKGAKQALANGVSQAFLDWCREHETGRVIALVNILAVTDTHTSRWYVPGNYAWELRVSHRCSSPRINGRLMLWRARDLELTGAMKPKKL